MKSCPSCGFAAHRVIYLGFPMWFCSDLRCSILWGFWSYIAVLMPIPTEDGMWCFYAYTDWYPFALFRWIFNI